MGAALHQAHAGASFGRFAPFDKRTTGCSYRRNHVPGAPAAVILAPPGGASSFPVVGDGTLRGTGRYVVFCFIPEGADVDEYLAQAAAGEGPPRVDGGPPHFALGMLGEIIVES